MVKGQIAARNHAKFYLEDGDVILQPYKDQIGGITLFCVHKGVLSFNSPVLRELFAKPPPGAKQPAKNEAAIEKPVYHMKDSALDLAEFLRAVYEPGYAPSQISTEKCSQSSARAGHSCSPRVHQIPRCG